MIPVTKPFQPPLGEYCTFLEGIWDRNWYTNNGPLVNDLELKLKQYLGIKHLLYLSNGTVAIQIALKALDITKKVITTPFSYVATTSSVVWEGCEPVFVDIDPDTLNINPDSIEEAITKDTEAILATHCFGNPCDVEAIQKIANRFNLKVIYDGAHCFGTLYDGESIFNWGDVCTTSFHATKLFHTVEGGAVFTRNPELLRRMAYLRNFGHDGPEKFSGVGINGKNSEFHAAMGVLNLRYISEILASRKKQSHAYDQLLAKVGFPKLKVLDRATVNHSYYPVLFKSEAEALLVKSNLEVKRVFTRRYFYPSLNTLGYLKPSSAPISEDISKRILCLPLYFGLSFEEQELICRSILRTLKYS
ncbi:MAG: DegT/DnrJ/EryC1/StrS family aminotransferase [Lunatimonas sp.]|uniref:DegT/DnrJ/EryC1/StrS family aminotransferase n=1 Tax=Lunatimonas sp. TaxID=2060141 RepID=UPI00263B8DF3|nr:DegT/DnrJ/EryC1/StrS family aminotransferase [Lunatimonas sp.]MCC5937201.1 DegT/DnrJ/EryC1/StrS family aminotransferase [Lunatimonas sp.]